MNILLRGLSILFMSPFLWGQTNGVDSDSLNIQNLDEVVLIDSRFPLKRSQSGRIVEKIDSETLRKFQGMDLAEVLRSRAGIDILGSRSQLGQNLTTSIRGGRNDQVLILIDGVRVNDASRIGTDFDLNFLPLEAIESIEILKGASGTLYGSSAATGVIDITTKKGAQDSLFSWGSSFGTLQAQESLSSGITAVENSFRYAETVGLSDVMLFFSQRYADGMSAVQGGQSDLFARNNFGFSGGHQFSDSYRIRFAINEDHIRSEYDGFDSNFNPAEANNLLVSNQWRFALQQNATYQNGELQLDLGYQSTGRDFQSDFPRYLKGTNLTLDLSNRYVFNEKLFSIVGYFYQHHTANISELENSSQHDLYANIVYASGSFNFNIGSRWNSHDVYGSHFIYNINPSYNFQIGKKYNVKALINIGTGFNTPSLFQLYDVFSGNNNLKPEESQTQEIGLDYTFLNGNFSVLYFKRLENPTLIYNFNTFRYANSEDEVSYSGLEMNYHNRIGSHLEFYLNYTLTETDGGDLRRIPKNAYRFGIDYELTSRLSLSSSFSKTGDRLAIDGTTILGSYSLLDARAQYQLNKPNAVVFLNVTNLLNQNFVEFTNYSTRGRNIMAGFNWNL